MGLQQLSRYRSFDGWTEFYSHPSRTTQTEMKFSVFRPPQAEKGVVPILYWLSGLTCTEENFMAKAGAQQYAAKHGLLLVAPDTSPRGAEVPGDGLGWDFGKGAGFYVNATEAPWSTNYRMYDYVANELPEIIRNAFPVNPDREGIFGHSMGGHGALILALKQQGRYRSVSAFSPISAPSQCPWGQKAFTHYLGGNRIAWAAYDAAALISDLPLDAQVPELLIDQGTEDKFLTEQLMPELLEAACRRRNVPFQVRRQKGYDHSYYFIASFMKDHIEHHAKALNAV